MTYPTRYPIDKSKLRPGDRVWLLGQVTSDERYPRIHIAGDELLERGMADVTFGHIEDRSQPHPLTADQEVVDLLEQNTRLTGKVAQLEYQASWAATEERAKIVTWLQMVKDEYRDPDGELADRVEAGEHLK